MIIFTNNLAEKLFGFAMSRDQLKNTGLCDILQDPNLQLDIDLAIDFNASVRGDEDAAERFTNTLILSSAFLDYSTVDFYTTRMEQYPIFEYHIDRITYIFENLDNINDYYAAASARDKSFIDNLKNALKDCLNSPCNLFAASSESMASIIDNVASNNSTTLPTLSALTSNPIPAITGYLKTTYGGIKNTLVKQLPDGIASTISKVSNLGQDAWSQSVDVLFEKDVEKKEKLIANALAGRAVDYQATGYTYVPDIESITNLEGFAASVLAQTASDLGGCFRKYQHLVRYSPFDPTQNLSVTSTTPVQDSVDGTSISRTSGGVVAVTRTRDLSCELPPADPIIDPPNVAALTIPEKEQFERIKSLIQKSKLNGFIPTSESDRIKYGITTGSADEWAFFFTKLAVRESSLNTNEVGDINRFKGNSNGLYQLSPLDFSNYATAMRAAGIRNGTTLEDKDGILRPAFTIEQLRDPDINSRAAIVIAEKLLLDDGTIGQDSTVGLARYWGPLRTGWSPKTQK